MAGLHIKVTDTISHDKHALYNEATNTLTLQKAGSYKAIIVEYEEEYVKITHEISALRNGASHSQKLLDDDLAMLVNTKSNWAILTPAEQHNYNLDTQIYEQDEKNNKNLQKSTPQKVSQQQDKLADLNTRYNDIRWIWNIASANMNFKIEDFNESLGTYGYRGAKELQFPKVLEGGMGAYLEAFHFNPVKSAAYPEGEQQIPQNKAPFGAFIKATGTPKIIGAMWKDKDGKEIKEKVAYGSTVYLHVYTEALYGQELKILLTNTNGQQTNLSVTERDADGQAVEKLDSTGFDKVFHRKVNACLAENGEMENVPEGTVSNQLIYNKGKETHKVIHFQKAKFAVLIDHAWQFQGGDNLTISPIIQSDKIKGGKVILDDCQLEVSKNNATYQYKEEHANSPVLIGDGDLIKTEGKKRIDFTFGIFIDGTLNNLYNTEARKAFEQRTNTTAATQKDVDKFNEKKYRYTDDSSYENDLSNPAIIYKNYIEDKKSNPLSRRFAIYTEGIGTLTHPDKDGNLNAKDYKNDDTVGYGIGTTAIYQNSGIKIKVRKAIEAMANIIIEILGKQSRATVGVLTVDVFGFSRGAAAARNFLHEINLAEYPVNRGVRGVALTDRHGYPVSNMYQTNPMLPSNGLLGYMLTENEIGIDKLIGRFAGLYDTVPHYGIFQAENVTELGLNNLQNVNYVVHLTAGDEHRYNFDLVSISGVPKTPPASGKKGGIELSLPGVHCDVGGSYVEGRPENKTRIEALARYANLNIFKQKLIHHGWFKPKELFILDSEGHATEKDSDSLLIKLSLDSKRPYLSNQYSFIPLHLMVEFCKIKHLPVNEISLMKAFSFKPNAIKGNIEFLNRIEARLRNYAFNGGEKYHFIEPEKLIPAEYNPLQQSFIEYIQNNDREQTKVNDDAELLNIDIKFLRNNYLHWNAVYGEGSIANILTQPHKPNNEKGIRDIH